MFANARWGYASHGDDDDSIASQLVWNLRNLLRNILFRFLSVGAISHHITFIMDGNRIYDRKRNLSEGESHNAGFLAVIRILKYYYELGVKYVTVYAFSIDNFNRKPHEVQILMNLFHIRMKDMEKVQGLVDQFGVRIHFCGDLSFLSPKLRKAAEALMKLTAKNTEAVLCVCLSYTSTNEISRVMKLSCEDRLSKTSEEAIQSREFAERSCCWGCGKGRIGLRDVEWGIDMAVAPEPNILVRTSGETRLRNFLLWKTPSCLLYSPATLWLEIGLRDLVWAVLCFQRCSDYLQRKRNLVHFAQHAR